MMTKRFTRQFDGIGITWLTPSGKRCLALYPDIETAREALAEFPKSFDAKIVRVDATLTETF